MFRVCLLLCAGYAHKKHITYFNAALFLLVAIAVTMNLVGFSSENPASVVTSHFSVSTHVVTLLGKVFLCLFMIFNL